MIDRNLKLVHELLANGADPNALDDDKCSPLHFAADIAAQVEIAPEMIRTLIKAGGNVNAQDSHGNTVLSTAVFHSNGDGNVIEILRAAGADPYIKNNYGVSALSLARTIANYDVARFFADLPAQQGVPADVARPAGERRG